MDQSKVEKCDIMTIEGRQKFDGIVRQVLQAAKAALFRKEVAMKLWKSPTLPQRRNVANSLKRGVRDGWAKTEGEGTWTRYRAK
jgi:hypothetical protein